MAGTLKLTDIEASSGSTITVAPATTLSLSADKLSVGGVLLSQGSTAVNVLTAASTDLADATHTAMWTGKSHAIFPVDASGGAKTVQLPAPDVAGRSTVSITISVKATTATATPNTVTVNNSSGAEIFTLYYTGDHVEFVSDGTNDIRTGNEHISAKGFLFRTSNLSMSGNTVINLFSAGVYTERYNYGSWFTTANYCVIVPFACRILVESLVYIDSTANQGITPAIRYYVSGRGSNDWIFYTNDKINDPVSNLTPSCIHDFNAGDEIEFNAFNLMVATAQTIVGSANGYYSGCYGKWTVLRRF